MDSFGYSIDSFWPNIKPGDVLADGIHAFMVMSKSSDSITIVEATITEKYIGAGRSPKTNYAKVYIVFTVFNRCGLHECAAQFNMW